MIENQLTNCDWLSFSVLMTLTEEEKATGPQLTPPPGYTLTEASGTNMYKHRAMLYNQHGDKVMTLLWQPHSRIIDGESLFVEVANPLLYDSRHLQVRDLLQQIHPHTWQSLSRLDIATDFQPTVAQMAVINMLRSGSAYVQGKRDASQWLTQTSADKYVTLQPHQLTWGNKNSQIKWKLYNKSKEIYETDTAGRTWCNKPYIAALWEANGFATDRDTWRIEVSIMSSGQLQWRGLRLSWDTVADPATLANLYYDLYQTRLKIRLNQGHENKRYDKEVPLLDVPEGDIFRIQKAVPASEQQHVAFAATLRALVAQLEKPEVEAAPAIHTPLLSVLEHVVTTAGLRGYFAAVTGRDVFQWTDEYIEKNRERRAPLPEAKDQKD